MDVATELKWWMPFASEASGQSAAQGRNSQEQVAQLKTRILLMDDEESIRLIGRAYLKRKGYDVVVTSDGASAVNAFKEARLSGAPFDLVILDLVVPGGMGGQEAMEAIRAIDANVLAIVSSGYSNDPVMAEFSRYGFDGCVPKPYELEQLADAIRQLSNRDSR